MATSEPLKVVPMDLFLQDQRRQDEDMRDTRTMISREVGNVVTELRGLRHDTTKAADQLRRETSAQTDRLTDALRTLSEEAEDRKKAEEAAAKRDFSRREKMFALALVAVPLFYSFAARVLDVFPH